MVMACNTNAPKRNSSGNPKSTVAQQRTQQRGNGTQQDATPDQAHSYLRLRGSGARPRHPGTMAGSASGVTGLNKGVNMNRMKLFCGLLLASFAVVAVADMCMLASESTSGMNKTCVYRCNSGEKSITIKSTSPCPLSI
jgi:hypothetical protein